MELIVKHQFNERERATITAALRHYQQSGWDDDHESILIDNNGESLALSNSEIDALCEKINR